MSTLKLTFLFALICGFVMVGCPEDDPVTDDDDDDDSAVGDDDDATADDDDDATADDDDDDDDATAGDDDDTMAGDPDIQTAPGALNFGVIAVGSTSDLPLDIRNLGTGDLQITNMVSPMSQINFTPFTGPIPPQGSETVVITAVCTIEEIATGNLIITSNDPDESPLSLQVSMDCDEM